MNYKLVLLIVSSGIGHGADKRMGPRSSHKLESSPLVVPSFCGFLDTQEVPLQNRH